MPSRHCLLSSGAVAAMTVLVVGEGPRAEMMGGRMLECYGHVVPWIYGFMSRN